MKINLSEIDPEHFNVKEGVVAGETCFLITPKDFGCQWTPHNLHLRSVIVNSKGEICSLGQKKFFNYGEKPDLYPNPENHKYWRISDKLDGSLNIFSKYKGELISRTRGCFSSKIHENGYEIDALLDKYPKIRAFEGFPEYSLLTEWVSKTQKIVLDYPEPDIYLLDVIKHFDCSYLPGGIVDDVAKDLGLKRPQKFEFNTLGEIVENCNTLIGREGYVLAYNNNQNRVKLKAQSYLLLHKFKSQATLENTVDLFVEYSCPSFNEFQDKLRKAFNEDCAAMVLGFCSEICDAHKEVLKIIEGMLNFLTKRSNYSRKDLALDVISSWGDTNRASFVFELKDYGKLKDASVKKLLWQCLKK